MAVSKLKPVNDILALHQSPTSHTHFGENYAQELSQKAELLPRTIQWHFIGGLQSGITSPIPLSQRERENQARLQRKEKENHKFLTKGLTYIPLSPGHCKSLAKIPNLFCVSSVDTPKKARLLNATRASDPSLAPLAVHVQVNTSGEEAKSGCAPGPEAVSLCREILESCPGLRLLGLMTIGAIARSRQSAPDADNDDFVLLRAQRDLVARELGLEPGRLELSMGMSDDFEGALRLGSDEVRVGSTIFGQRPLKADAKLKE